MHPRILSIPDHLKTLIARHMRFACWTEADIASFTASVLVSIERQVKVIEADMWRFLDTKCPESREFAHRKVDLLSCRVVEIDAEGNETNRSIEVPQEFREELHDYADEMDTIAGARKASGFAAMAIRETVERSMAKVMDVIRLNIPQCAVGEWMIDFNEMVVVEKVSGDKEKKDAT
jgi:hypothetical protein